MKKSFTLLFYLLSLSISGLLGSFDALASKDPSSENSLKKPNNSVVSSTPWQQRYHSDAEIVSLRSRNTKHFRNPSGNFSAFTASGSIHYKKGNQWLEIDNTILSSTTNDKNYPYVNNTNSFAVSYPSSIQNNPVLIDVEGKQIREQLVAVYAADMSGKKLYQLPTNTKCEILVDGNTITYVNYINGVDVIFTQRNDGKKFDLRINNQAALASIPANASQLLIEELVTLPTGVSVKHNAGGILINQNGKQLVNYIAPEAFETSSANKVYVTEEEYTTAGTYAFKVNGNQVSVTTTFSLNWLKAATRNYPVYLDPSANYGPFAVSMATGRMTTATGTKTDGFLRLAGTNTFTWAKFNIASFASVGAISVDSANYWGYFYSTTQTTNKVVKVVEMDSMDVVTALNTDIVSKINAKSNISSNYVFAGTAGYTWYKAPLDTTLHNPAFRNNITRGYTSVGMAYLSGSTTFAYHYGREAIGGTNNALVCYLEVFYTLPPCSNPAVAGSVTGTSLVCGGSNLTVNLIGATTGLGTTYQWQVSPDSITWTNVTGANNTTFTGAMNTDSSYYRCEVICSFGTPAYTNAFLVKADVFTVTPTASYNEGFEGITANNQLPSCMASTNLGTLTTTYTAAAGSYNRFARTGSKYGSFRYGCNDFFFTKGLKLQAGVTYSFSTWFVTDGYTGSWDSVALYVATGTTAASATLLPGATVIQPSNVTYQKLTGSFTPTATGVYRFAFKVKDAGIPWYLSIDDIKVEVAQAPTLITGTKTNITTSGATLSGNITADGGAAVTQSGVVVSTSPSPVRGGFGVIDSASNPNIGMGNYSVNVAGLSLATTYYYRAYAINPIGISYGADSTFTTNAASAVPTVVKTSPTNVQAYTATVGGNITSDGGAAVFASGIVYSTTPNPAIGGFGVVDSTTNPVTALGAFTKSLGGIPSTKYYYRAYAINSVGTAYSIQDSFTTAPVVAFFPYMQNFDTIGLNTGWTSVAVTGTLNDWVAGTPAKTTLSAALSTPTAWITKTTGTYSTSHDAALVSPQFNFSALVANPILRFKHKFYTESCCDGGILEISTNGGLSWTKVENTVGTGANFNTANAIAWYNGTAQGNTWNNLSSAYSTATNGWISSMIALPGAAGQSNVKIRFRFITDTSVEYDGWAIDDIEVFVPSAPTVITGTKTNLTTSNATLAGNITNNGGNNVTASGVVISTSAAPVRGAFGVIDSATNPLVSGGTYTLNITGLTASTTYYYRAYAVNAVGTSYGADSTFTTPGAATIPTVVRNTATNVQAYSATVGGNITSDGGSVVFASGVVYATTPNPALFGVGVIDSTTTPAVATGSFSINPAGLLHSTKYYYRAYATNAVGTAYSVQDSFTTSPVVSVFPYAQNFDVIGVNTGWNSAIVAGTLNNWTLGIPAKTFLSGAFSGTQAWVTKLTGSYDDNHDAAVVSPQFDFSALTAAPILRFKHKFVTETGWDALIVEMSINGGAWTKVDNNVGTGTNFNTVLSTSWYNSTSTSGPIAPAKFSGANTATIYSSQASGWITSVTPLVGANGQSNVKVRFRFGSDASGTDEGVSLDNIEVFVPAAPTVVTGTKTNVTTANATLAGNITNNGGNNVTASGIVISTSASPVRGGFGVVDSATNPLIGNGAYTVNVTGLTASTTYYYRAYAVNAVGTSYGADSTFTTPGAAIVPTVVSSAATNIGTTTAILSGNITSDGGATVIASGVVYSTTINPVIGGLGVIDSTTVPVKTMGSYTVNPAGLIHSTKYYFRAYATNSVGTAYSSLDSFTTSPIITSLPYTQNFDGVGNTGWSSTALNAGTNSWQLGTPAKTFLNGAYSGTKAWVTQLTGNYLGTEDCGLVSPQFDFSTLTVDPVIRFRHKMDVDADIGWDGGVVEISINGGAWTRLNSAIGTGTNYNTATSYAWYNDASGFYTLGANMFSMISTSYSSNTSGWIESATRLTGAAGQANVKVRFRFAADGFTDEGWAVDNIEVVNVVTPTTLASGVTVTPTANAATVNFTAGNGQGRMVVARLTTSAAVAPANNTLYTASAAFGSANITGTGNYIVYMGAGTSASVTGLTASTGYTFDVYEFNGKYMHVSFAAAATSSTTTTPVKLLNFVGVKNANDAQLTWVTASERNNSGFNLERSLDGKNFEFVAFLQGKGNSNVKVNYAYTDKAVFANNTVSKVFYRLKQLDVDGKFEYSSIVSVVNQTAKVSSVEAYPNPFNSSINVSIVAVKVSTATVEIFDISGRKLFSNNYQVEEGSNSIAISKLAELNQGIYFVRVDVDGEVKVIKMIKN